MSIHLVADSIPTSVELPDLTATRFGHICLIYPSQATKGRYIVKSLADKNCVPVAFTSFLSALTHIEYLCAWSQVIS